VTHDGLGNPISPCRPETASAIDDFVFGFLGYDVRIVNVLAAADNDAGNALVNAYAGLLWMLSETGGVPEQARRYLSSGEQAESASLPRERDIVQVLRLWIADDVPGSLQCIERILQTHPRDLVMLKLHQYHSFNAGDFPAMLRVALASLDAAADIAHLHGMQAFAYEQLHLLDKAEQSARHALALLPREPWAQHALAHVMLTQGRIGEGVAFLESVRDEWIGLTSFMYTHLWWHLALFYLSQGRFTEALAAYDDHCWFQQKDFSQDQIGAVSLLARLGFAGIDVGARWSDLGPYLAARQDDVSQPFLTLQYLYGLARAGRPEAAHLLANIRRAPVDGPQSSRDVWRIVGVRLAEGLSAHAAGDHEAALQLIEPQLGQLMDIGGSHAQRDLFDQIVLDALLHTGRFRRAQQILELRRLSDRDGVPVNRALAHVYERLNLPSLAAEARGRMESKQGLLF
jgi:tetratricopeptide (TPR) repeat protein